ncbi:aldehyde dehydrogenase family protein [Bradyrhizobium sp.]|uniref:aldehyde dehydrogenase family protein n=1 Tax=Bradyrhizobium sp. TaxID=376 RepID=UPI002C4DA173|nr:aldehyde dehydrogenase family protein [Bradyrhizobium sp.]HMM91745.1 aldehyde dehydrogenase family protein [Bradyrhizobium sp.]
MAAAGRWLPQHHADTARSANAARVDRKTHQRQRGAVPESSSDGGAERRLARKSAKPATSGAGGPGRPADLNRGYYVRPTVFGHVTPQMKIAREEIFGPVLSIIGYDTEDDAVDIANDTPFGLAGFVQSGDAVRARKVANRIRAGRVYLNGAPFDRSLPFGGYKQSGNGREFGVFGFEEYLEVKAIVG